MDETLQAEVLGLDDGVTFIMEQVMGHRTYYQNLRLAVVDLEATSLSAFWAEVDYRVQPGGWLERLPLLTSRLKGYAVGIVQTGQGLWRGRRSQVVFFHTQKPAALYGQFPHRRPWILSVDVTPLQYDQLGLLYNDPGDRPGPVQALKHRLNHRLFHSAHLIIVWSEWVQRSLLMDYGVDQAKIVVIPPGVDLERWRRGKGETDLQCPTPANRPKVLFCGGDWERKGGPLLLACWEQEGYRLCELHLVTRHRFSPLVSQQSGLYIYNDLNSNDPALIRLYQEADLFVMPSRAECFGIALIEAMAMGLPVITTNLAALPEIVSEGQTGFLITPQDGVALADRLNHLLTDPVLRHSMGQAGRQVAVECYDIRKNTKAVLKAIARVLD